MAPVEWDGPVWYKVSHVDGVRVRVLRHKGFPYVWNIMWGWDQLDRLSAGGFIGGELYTHHEGVAQQIAEWKRQWERQRAALRIKSEKP